MGNSDDYRKGYREASRDVYWTLPKIFGLIVVLMIFFVALGIIGRAVGWFGRVAEVASQQYDPQTMLDRYQWFKDASAALDAKTANVKVYEKRFTDLKMEYNGAPRQKWAREDREQWSTWQSEVAGIKASYNSLAAEYNANMAKFNYAFTNTGNLPTGVDKHGQPITVLPRDYKPYETE